MTWKEAANASLEAIDGEFQFALPATDQEISELEASLDAKIPDALRSLWAEFNGATYYDQQFIPARDASSVWKDVYESWHVENAEAKTWFANIAFFYVENGVATMAGLVVKPFGKFIYGQLVVFDHDGFMYAESPENCYAAPEESLLEYVKSESKSRDADY